MKMCEIVDKKFVTKNIFLIIIKCIILLLFLSIFICLIYNHLPLGM